MRSPCPILSALRPSILVTGYGLGAYLFHSDGAWAALSIAPELRERRVSDEERLRGLGDVRRTARAEFQRVTRRGGFRPRRQFIAA